MLWSNRASRTVYTDVIPYQRIWHDHDNGKPAVGLAAARGARSVGGSVFSWVVVRGVAGRCNTVVISAVNGTYIICRSSIRCSSIHCSNIRHSVLAPRSGLVLVIGYEPWICHLSRHYITWPETAFSKCTYTHSSLVTNYYKINADHSKLLQISIAHNTTYLP